MKKEQLFGNARWIAASVDNIESAIMIRRAFEVSGIKSARLRVIGFGTFEVRERAERKGRNPKTGETITIAASKTPSFSAGKALKDAIN